MRVLNSEFSGGLDTRTPEDDGLLKAITVYEGFAGRPEEFIEFLAKLKQLCADDLTARIEKCKAEINQAQVYLERLNTI